MCTIQIVKYDDRMSKCISFVKTPSIGSFYITRIGLRNIAWVPRFENLYVSQIRQTALTAP